MDTLNWARLGATVTGLDFSEAAVRRARALASEIGVHDATFIQSNVYEARDVITSEFDIVYTGIGALNWLPDIRRWALNVDPEEGDLSYFPMTFERHWRHSENRWIRGQTDPLLLPSNCIRSRSVVP